MLVVMFTYGFLSLPVAWQKVTRWLSADADAAKPTTAKAATRAATRVDARVRRRRT